MCGYACPFLDYHSYIYVCRYACLFLDYHSYICVCTFAYSIIYSHSPFPKQNITNLSWHTHQGMYGAPGYAQDRYASGDQRHGSSTQSSSTWQGSSSSSNYNSAPGRGGSGWGDGNRNGPPGKGGGSWGQRNPGPSGAWGGSAGSNGAMPGSMQQEGHDRRDAGRPQRWEQASGDPSAGRGMDSRPPSRGGQFQSYGRNTGGYAGRGGSDRGYGGRPSGGDSKQFHEMVRQAISNARTRSQLMSVILDHKRRARGTLNHYSAASTSMALNKLTKLQGGERMPFHEKKSYLTCINALFTRVASLCHVLNSRGASIVAHAAAIMQRNDTVLYQRLFKRICEPEIMKEMSSQGISNILWSMGRLNLRDDTTVQTLCDHVCHPPPDSNISISTFNIMDIANSLVGLGALGKRHEVFTNLLLDRALDPSLQPQLNEIILSQLLMAFAQLEIYSEDRLGPLLQRMNEHRDLRVANQDVASEGNATAQNRTSEREASFDLDKRSLSSCLWALVKLQGHVEGNVAAIVESHIHSLKQILAGKCTYLPEQQVMLLLDAFGTGKWRDEQLLEEVCNRAIKMFTNATVDKLRRIMDKCEGFVAEDGHGQNMVVVLRATLLEKEEIAKAQQANGTQHTGRNTQWTSGMYIFMYFVFLGTR